MAITTTPRLGLSQWGAGSDAGPNRVSFNSLLDRIDDYAAIDLGEQGGAALPTDVVVDGRYAQTTEGVYRRLFRRAGGAWQQVGGNTWSETQYERAATGAAQTASARERSHPSLANPTVIERWDGSSIRGGRQAIGDVNTGQPGALLVGDTASAADLATLGRIYARTTAAGQRGFVASAGGNDHGPMFTAREVGGTVPWLVDARGRMQAQAPTAFGGAGAVTDGVPLFVAPGGNDTVAIDAYAGTGKPAQRWWRAVGDTTPIGMIEQTKITLGRSVWTGGRVDVLGPGLYVEKDLQVVGNETVGGTLGVSGASTLAALTAASAQINGNATITGTTTLQGTVNLSGRLDLPTNLPGGTSSGQVRISDDWNIEVYDGSRWRGRFGNRSGRVHQWDETSATATVAPGNEARCSGLKAASGNGTLATVSSGNLYLNRAGLWAIDWDVSGDFGGGNARLAATLKWPAGGFWVNTAAAADSISTYAYSTGGFPGSGGYRMRTTWTGYVPASLVGTPIGIYCYQNNSAGATLASWYHLRAEWLSD